MIWFICGVLAIACVVLAATFVLGAIYVVLAFIWEIIVDAINS